MLLYGLSVYDVKGLRNDPIGIGIDGQKWIFKNRQETDTKSKTDIANSRRID